jgi:hypothetical protein
MTMGQTRQFRTTTTHQKWLDSESRGIATRGLLKSRPEFLLCNISEATVENVSKPNRELELEQTRGFFLLLFSMETHQTAKILETATF